MAALEARSFTGAARTLGVSQPAVAEQIQRLERAVGQSLFARQARGVTATRAGTELEPHARRVLDAAREAMDFASDANTVGRGVVAFGTFGTPQHYGFADLVRAFLIDHPDVRVQLIGRNSSTTAMSVRTGVLDAAVVALPIDDTALDVRPIFTGEVFYVSANPDRTSQPVAIDALASRSFILYEAFFGTADPCRQQLAARAQAAGVQIDARVEVEFAETALDLAANGVGDTYAPQVLIRTLDPRLTAASFDPPLVDRFALITRSGARLSLPVRDFIERIVAHLAAISSSFTVH